MSAKKNKDLFLELSDSLLSDSNEAMDIDMSVDLDLSDVTSTAAEVTQISANTEAIKKESSVSQESKSIEGLDSNKSYDLEQTLAITNDNTKTIAVSDETSVQEVPELQVIGGVDNSLFELDSLSVANERIKSLEKELQKLRVENEQVSAAAETFKTKYDFLKAGSEDSVLKYQSLKETVEEEKQLFLTSLTDKDRESEELRQKNEELEMRLVTSFKKVRSRERELENRLELLKAEGNALTRNKDELILDLKRQIDHMGLEIESFRMKNQKVQKQLMQKKDLLRKVIRSLRIALTLSETDEAIEVSRNTSEEETEQAS